MGKSRANVMAHDVLRQQHDNLLEQYDRNLDLLDDVQRDIKESFEEKFGGNAQQKGYLDEWLSDKGEVCSRAAQRGLAHISY